MWLDSNQGRTGLADGMRSKHDSRYDPCTVRRRFSWLQLSAIRSLSSGAARDVGYGEKCDYMLRFAIRVERLLSLII